MISEINKEQIEKQIIALKDYLNSLEEMQKKYLYIHETYTFPTIYVDDSSFVSYNGQRSLNLFPYRSDLKQQIDDIKQAIDILEIRINCKHEKIQEIDDYNYHHRENWTIERCVDCRVDVRRC